MLLTGAVVSICIALTDRKPSVRRGEESLESHTSLSGGS